MRVKQVGNLFGMEVNPMWGRIYDPDGIAPTLSTMQGGYRIPMILLKANTKSGYSEITRGGYSITPNQTAKQGGEE